MAEDDKTPTRKAAAKKKGASAAGNPATKKKTIARKKASAVKKVAPRRKTPAPPPGPQAVTAVAPEVVTPAEPPPEPAPVPSYAPDPGPDTRDGGGVSSILALWGPLALILLLIVVTRVGGAPEQDAVAKTADRGGAAVPESVAINAATRTSPAPVAPTTLETAPVVEPVTIAAAPALLSKADALAAAFRDAGLTTPKAPARAVAPAAAAAAAAAAVATPEALPGTASDSAAPPAPAPGSVVTAQGPNAPLYPPLPGPYRNPWAAGAGGPGFAYWGPGAAGAKRGDIPPPPPGATAGQGKPGYPTGPAAGWPPMAAYPMPMYYWVPVPVYGPRFGSPAPYPE